ncbi:polysaccharide biosynthesis tyrosine autokinase [Cyanobium sp. Cruz CV13-4-11]|uniref:GumC family protein n=1 Tax=unclassified Cyanobium TaxID=2627006 RepID=UPI0020CCD597|nr:MULTISPECIES: polysaccharide biosynthesis tyrosine autokinase [unclassified Cyanobium]MCP9900230.1 polysaccharide biosynthesis tyrosine autokinase [Cyanobium sp. Cruz CV11-17]MCP9918543.1 polysaccharide biosynthesis tyrosine autokinase [Cyanobium sp. Cruz CV13-4-11]
MIWDEKPTTVINRISTIDGQVKGTFSGGCHYHSWTLYAVHNLTTTGVPSKTFTGGTQRPLSLPPTTGSGPSFAQSFDPSLQSPQNPTGEGQSGGVGLGGLVRTIKRRQSVFLVTFAVVTGVLAINTLRQRIFSPVYQGGFQMQISNPFDTPGGGGGGGGGSVESIARSEIRIDVPSLIVLMRSPLLLGPVAQRQGVPLSALESNLSIDQESARVDNVLNVSLRWPDPTKGQVILRQLAKDYTAFSLTQRQAAMNSGVQFLDEQAPAIESRVQKLSLEMLKFRERNNFVDPATAASQILGAREELVNQLRTLQNEQVQLDSQLTSIQTGKLQFTPSGAPTALQQLGRNSVLVPGRASSGAEAAREIATPLDLLNQFEQELATAKGTFKENSPIVQSLLARRNQLLPVVQRQAADAVKARLLSNVAQQDEINRQILLLSENFRNNPQKMAEFESINQRLSIAREQYSSYIQARERYRLEMARSITPWEVIGPPDFGGSPVEPNIQRNLLRAIMIGLLAGLGAAILREKTDNVFHTPMEVEKELQLPVLGLIPYLPLDPGVDIATSISKMSSSERFAIKESLRSLFTTFRLLRADSNIRLVGVTSSTQGEGKSTAVSVFARTLADLGLKVLVVDSDMRLPMQARYLGVEQGDGLSTLLSDSSRKPTEFIHSVAENMDMLPAGPKPPDPAKLLNSSRCKDVIEDIRALPGYDIVIVDAPPCLMLADPILLGEKLDGILFLVGLGKVSRQLAPQASRRIRASGVDVLGIICNQVNLPSRLNDYGYEYGYYYHYAYASESGYAKSATEPSSGRFGSYVQRYRDSYMKGAATNSYVSARYNEGESDVKTYYRDEEGQPSGPSPSNGGNLPSTGSGSVSPAESVPSRRHRQDDDASGGDSPISWLRKRFGNRG